MKKAWLRQIEITLMSYKLKRKFIIADYANGKNALNIKISGNKYLSSLKDEFTIEIDNLTYKEVVEIISGQYYEVEIKAGYKELGLKSIFKGSIFYISNKFGNGKTNTIIILCTSNLVAKFGQAKLNLTLNSGINLYAAIKFILKKSGLDNAYIDEDFKNRFLQEVESANKTISNWLDVFTKSNDLVINADSTKGVDVSLWSPYKKDNRIVFLKNDNVLLVGGYPTLNSEGIDLNILPTISLFPGDTIQIDNSILDLSVSSKSEVTSNPAMYLNSEGKYMIYQLSYNLTNRDSEFNVNILAKSRNLINEVIK